MPLTLPLTLALALPRTLTRTLVNPSPIAGIAPKVVRALASGAIQFSTYEATKEWSLNFLARRFPQL